MMNIGDWPRYYRRDGTPYPRGDKGLFEWAADYEDLKKKIVKQDRLPNKVRVSTVWLGLDHNWGDKNRPQIFETMVFFGKGYEDEECWRYATEEEALRGHKMLVKKWSAYKTAEQVLKGKK